MTRNIIYNLQGIVQINVARVVLWTNWHWSATSYFLAFNRRCFVFAVPRKILQFSFGKSWKNFYLLTVCMKLSCTRRTKMLLTSEESIPPFETKRSQTASCVSKSIPMQTVQASQCVNPFQTCKRCLRWWQRYLNNETCVVFSSSSQFSPDVKGDVSLFRPRVQIKPDVTPKSFLPGVRTRPHPIP